jgi:hypothetical protein
MPPLARFQDWRASFTGPLRNHSLILMCRSVSFMSGASPVFLSLFQQNRIMLSFQFQGGQPRELSCTYSLICVLRSALHAQQHSCTAGTASISISAATSMFMDTTPPSIKASNAAVLTKPPLKLRRPAPFSSLVVYHQAATTHSSAPAPPTSSWGTPGIVSSPTTTATAAWKHFYSRNHPTKCSEAQLPPALGCLQYTTAVR